MTQILISKHNRFDHSKLEIGIYLEFGIWNFEDFR